MVAKRIIRNRWLYRMAAPGLIYFAVFKYAPMYGVVIAFQNYSRSWAYQEANGLASAFRSLLLDGNLLEAIPKDAPRSWCITSFSSFRCPLSLHCC